MNFMRVLNVVITLCCLVAPPIGYSQQRLLVQGEGKLAIVNSEGTIEWEMPWGSIHDMHVLANGNVLVPRGAAEIAELDPKSKSVVWSYDAANQNGNAGKKVEVHAFQPLDDGNIMLAESGPARIIEIDRAGRLLKEVKLQVRRPHPHTDTRLARKIASGNYLVCHEGDGTVREYDGKSGEVIWEFEIPLFGQQPAPGHGPEAFGNKCFAAVRLSSGNTLITTGNGHGVLEVTSDMKIVRRISQKDLPGITLAWVTTIEVLPSGHWLIGNCHGGSANPLVVEYDPETKKVVWQFRGFGSFGNNVSNTLALDWVGKSLR
jgi:outer membrane protein assembly factor BamB